MEEIYHLRLNVVIHNDTGYNISLIRILRDVFVSAQCQHFVWVARQSVLCEEQEQRG